MASLLAALVPWRAGVGSGAGPRGLLGRIAAAAAAGGARGAGAQDARGEHPLLLLLLLLLLLWRALHTRYRGRRLQRSRCGGGGDGARRLTL